ncbi:hypothetical protein BmR1_04g08185 [Babesia microti strain RI]|uniref:Uncharacterized protein n=1 Tax=Babesia microti (strain RI) TaxID=1133968 RepID=I7ISR6_BABMR|nr:hypothetical protein BmR1_04g08185 [Babesia microti strain RI]CCF75821.1 hypothetical protein BmR1_04g08185 [Babesia microti strain RI]|eukprot:XP_012650229.1 hypothetical protein BmR1_04g08185 [Babesia microti strain RI]
MAAHPTTPYIPRAHGVRPNPQHIQPGKWNRKEAQTRTQNN